MKLEKKEPLCGDCGEELTLVRPGSHQCDNIKCVQNNPTTPLSETADEGKWRVESETSPIADTGDYQTQDWLTNGTITLEEIHREVFRLYPEIEKEIDDLKRHINSNTEIHIAIQKASEQWFDKFREQRILMMDMVKILEHYNTKEDDLIVNVLERFDKMTAITGYIPNPPKS